MKKLNKTIIATCLSLATSIVIAAPELSSVNKSNCNKLVNTTETFVLVLSHGDHLNESINKCAKDAKLQGATITGLGQVLNPTLAYFNPDPTIKPALTTKPGVFELASLTGDISNNSGKYFTHIHGVVADEQFHAIAGHINDATVGLTAEIIIKPLSKNLRRKGDEKTGFRPLET